MYMYLKYCVHVPLAICVGLTLYIKFVQGTLQRLDTQPILVVKLPRQDLFGFGDFSCLQ